jgi:hypothetical protein
VRIAFLLSTLLLASAGCAHGDGYVPLFTGKDLSGWRVPEGDNGHWKVLDGTIDYDARSESPRDKSLWTAQDYGDFVLDVEWRIKDVEWRIKETAPNDRITDILPDGSERLGPDGKPITLQISNADSGILLRGTSKAQVNIWCWPVGSGEVWGFRRDMNLPPEVRAGVTPRVRADNPVGQWNRFIITMKGERLTVDLNGRRVIENAALPGVPPIGPIGLQHHGTFENGKYNGAASVVQFRNIRIRSLRSLR